MFYLGGAANIRLCRSRVNIIIENIISIMPFRRSEKGYVDFLRSRPPSALQPDTVTFIRFNRTAYEIQKSTFSVEFAIFSTQKGLTSLLFKNCYVFSCVTRTELEGRRKGKDEYE